MLKVFNTMGRKKMVFKPLRKNEVRMYTCGPTVYAVPHIGNFRSFVMSDNIRRYLEFKGFGVRHVMNITDIDDKTIRDSEKNEMALKDFTKKYTKLFFDGLEKLNIKKAWKYPRAAAHVNGMIKITEVLVKSGFAYEKGGSVYFEISKFKDYGKLSKIDLGKIKIGATVDVDEYEKKNPKDFALVKKSTPEEVKRGIYYESPWGKVRPGWHIECSALSMMYLGNMLDIHTGGVDLIFPHHENEIAQSEAYTGKKFVRYWLHGEHLIVNGEKMSKSKGNYFTLNDLLKKYDSDVIRYMFASTHYRKKLNYTEKLAENAKKNYEKLRETLEKLERTLKFKTKNEMGDEDKKFIKKLSQFKKGFINAMDDDFNTPLALSVLHRMSKKINTYIETGKNKTALKKCISLFKELCGLLGLFEKKQKIVALNKKIKELIKKRELARKRKDWETADKIRHDLKKMGIILEDTKHGVRVKTE